MNVTRNTPPMEPSFACLRCWKLKKKCDKGHPHCKRCVAADNGLSCIYSNEPPTGREQRFTQQRLVLTREQIYQNSGSTSSSSPNATDSTEDSEARLEDIASSPHSLHSAFHSLQHDLPRILRIYFLTTNTWFPIITQLQAGDLRRGIGPLPDKELCTLLLSVYLVTVEKAEGDTYLRKLYTKLKDSHDRLYSSSTQHLTIIQIGMLLALYEQGQSLHHLSYLSMGAAVRLAQSINLHRTIRIRLEDCELTMSVVEQQRHVWWCLVILERVLALHSEDSLLPFASAAPRITDYLPSTWGSEGQADGGIEIGHLSDAYSQFPEIHLPFTNPLGESVQATFLLAKVFDHINHENLSPVQRQQEVEYLDQLLQNYLLRALDERRKAKGDMWHYACGAFFICMSARIRLHIHNLAHMSPDARMISQESTQRSLLAIYTISRIGTESKHMAQALGENDEFMKEENMPPFTLHSSRDVALIALPMLYSPQEGAGDEAFWKGILDFYRASFEVAKRKWGLGAEYLELLKEREGQLHR